MLLSNTFLIIFQVGDFSFFESDRQINYVKQKVFLKKNVFYFIFLFILHFQWASK